MNFYDYRLEIAEDYGTQLTYSFDTAITTTSGGQEYRNINLELGLCSFDISKSIVYQDWLAYLLDFHSQVKGAFSGFRFKDWADYKAFATPPETNLPHRTFGCALPTDQIDEYQLCKAYQLTLYVYGDPVPHDVIVYRPITRPVADTIIVYHNGVMITATVEVETGRFTQAGLDYSLIRCDFEFDVPVRFENDSLIYRYASINTSEAYIDTIFELPKLAIKEIREPITAILPNVALSPLEIELPFSLLWDAIATNSYSTQITRFKNQAEQRIQYQSEPLCSWALPEKILDSDQVDFLISLFRITRGAGLPFRFTDISGVYKPEESLLVRFDSDNLIFSFLGSDEITGERLFRSGEIILKETHIDSEVYSFSRIWEIERSDDNNFYFTDCDRPLLTIDDNLALPNAGFDFSALSENLENKVNDGEIEAILSADSITEKDLLLKKFDDAKLTIYITNRGQLTAISDFVVFKGILGQVQLSNSKFKVEARSYSQYLQQARSKKTTSICPLEFGKQGDNQCNKDLTGLIETTTITAVFAATYFQIGISPANDFFTYGKCLFLSGNNEGITIGIIKYAGQRITLWELPPYPITLGDQLQLTAGCARTFQACQDYNNAVNFGGQPHIPGTDVLMRGAIKSI